MLGGWLNQIKEDIISYVEVWETAKAIVKNWDKMFKLFVDFDSTCSSCTNERMADFGYWSLLKLLIPQIPMLLSTSLTAELTKTIRMSIKNIKMKFGIQ